MPTSESLATVCFLRPVRNLIENSASETRIITTKLTGDSVKYLISKNQNFFCIYIYIYIYIYIRINDWTMPGGATTCLNKQDSKAKCLMRDVNS